MKSPFAKSILLIFAHPDDHVLAAGTILKYKSLGYFVHEVLLTKGEEGLVLGGKIGKNKTGEIRKQEYLTAKNFLQIDDFTFLNQRDGEVVYSHDDVLKITHLIRRLKPHIIISFAEMDLHPDHSQASKMALQAVKLANLSVDLWPNELRFRTPKYLQVFGYVQGRTDFLIDISDFKDKKEKLLKIYTSQKSHLMKDTIEVIDKRNGLVCGGVLEAFKIHPDWPMVEY